LTKLTRCLEELEEPGCGITVSVLMLDARPFLIAVVHKIAWEAG
jgi:hypothetical protein